MQQQLYISMPAAAVAASATQHLDAVTQMELSITPVRVWLAQRGLAFLPFSGTRWVTGALGARLGCFCCLEGDTVDATVEGIPLCPTALADCPIQATTYRIFRVAVEIRFVDAAGAFIDGSTVTNLAWEPLVGASKLSVILVM